MSNIIEEIYNSDLFLCRKLNTDDDEYRKALDSLVEAEDALLEDHPEIRRLFVAYQNAQIAIINISNRMEFTTVGIEKFSDKHCKTGTASKKYIK